ncbi:hypothetical protein [Phenylobacterium sp. 58.2.17]|jgi:hypothetical protein|uniref:hypothetical protein n=1 Tax=Phenylobacterium sp. 58.2.17 TaxID=2969306 RepID=UPI0022646826|nr:hypothetical protein [Phenylobacterium sp. 58.2.17]MCX7588229.1 hypothetical protein [Phenylobacterium sp. 58.2.17]
MWNLIRIFVAALALVGFVGQTTARAMPMMARVEAAVAAEHVAMAGMDCADMPGMSPKADAPEPRSKPTPCKGVTLDCIGKMGCATVAPPIPTMAGIAHAFIYEGVRFPPSDLTREGVLAPLLFHPPRPLA